MKTIYKLAFIVAVVFGLTAIGARVALADCPDGEYHCPATGDIIKYGQCYKFPLSCNRCNKNDDAQKCSQSERTDWMLDARIQSKTLSDITLPAAHDASMGIANHCTDYAFDDITKTQTRSMLEMLNSGIRYFDIRPTVSKDGVMRIGHVAWIGYDVDIVVKKFTARNEGCYGYNLDAVMNDINKFRNNHPSELIILELSHFQNFKTHDIKNSYFDETDFNNLKGIISEGIGKHLVKGERELLNSTIKELANSGVLILMDGGPAQPADGFHSAGSLHRSGKYTNTNKIDTMVKDQLSQLENRRDGHFHRTFWTLTLQQSDIKSCILSHFSGPLANCTNILSYASKANSNLFVLLDAIKRTGRQPNIIFTDNSDYRLTDIAIEANNQ
jgi:hypothetical protein